MTPFQNFTELTVRTSAHRLADSALPDAPILPWNEPRHPVRRALRTSSAAVRGLVAGRPTVRHGRRSRRWAMISEWRE
jgi:hypothetical protein